MPKLVKPRFLRLSQKQMRRVGSEDGAHIAIAAKRARQLTGLTRRSAPLSKLRNRSTTLGPRTCQITKHLRMDLQTAYPSFFTASQIREPFWKQKPKWQLAASSAIWTGR